MKASVAEKNHGICPKCEMRVSKDRKCLGVVRHLKRKPDGTKCDYGWKERDA